MDSKPGPSLLKPCVCRVEVVSEAFHCRFVGMFLFDLGFFLMGCEFFGVCFVVLFCLVFLGGEREECEGFIIAY